MVEINPNYFNLSGDTDNEWFVQCSRIPGTVKYKISIYDTKMYGPNQPLIVEGDFLSVYCKATLLKIQYRHARH